LHALPSLQNVPLAIGAFVHAPELHTSVVHGLPSLQSAPPTQARQPLINV
jgi:hypothetical protein